MTLEPPSPRTEPLRSAAGGFSVGDPGNGIRETKTYPKQTQRQTRNRPQTYPPKQTIPKQTPNKPKTYPNRPKTYPNPT